MQDHEHEDDYLDKLKDPEFQKLVKESREKVLIQRKHQSMVVTSRQAKQQLVLSGLYGSVQSAISDIEDPNEKQMVEIYWNDATDFERSNAQLQLLAKKLGLSDEELDNLFFEAAKL